MEKYAVIVAGGMGSRMGTSIPKQFLELKGKPLLFYSINAFLDAFSDLEVILVLPQQHMDTGAAMIAAVKDPRRVQLATGGATRFHSVKNGLDKVNQESVVFVHDGVRCLVTPELIHRCYELTLKKGNAIPAIAATDSIRIVTGNENEQADRNSIRIIQTPQTFLSGIIKTAFEQEYNEAFTDEATVVENTGIKINLAEGDTSNIKITHPIDLMIAEKILELRVLS
jgi:2-C-methyl-D-erythritol 4-phosphate cytidylyltransferase